MLLQSDGCYDCLSETLRIYSKVAIRSLGGHLHPLYRFFLASNLQQNLKHSLTLNVERRVSSFSV